MKTRKKKKLDLIIYLILIISLICFNIAIFNIIKWNRDSKDTIEAINNVQSIVDVEEIEETSNTETSTSTSNITNTNLINVDFNQIKSLNSDTKAWLKVSGTNINYPVVQTTDNTFYLSHTFDKSKNSAGWVFFDYRNNIGGNDTNTIIYAHARKDKTMFGSLSNTLNSSWYNNKDNYIIKLSTENENTLWQIFSIYKVPTTTDYLKVNFKTDEEYAEFINLITNRSIYNFNTEVTTDDRILTLSTCSGKEKKLVVHAKLIKTESK
jgi:sortase B